MMKTILMTGVAASLSLISVAAQARANDADRTFLNQDVQGGRYELALAKLGATKATKANIRSYSQMVVRDHQTANAMLMRLVKQEGVNPPAGMTADDQKMLTKLRGMSGNNFDRAYVDEMNRINAEDKQAADKEKASTNEPAIKSYISRFADTDAKHLQMAQKLRSEV